MIMMVKMMRANIYWLSAFPVEDGVSSQMRPGQIINGHIPDYNLHCQLQFGTYVQVHNKGDNSILSQTTGALALRPIGNDQGGYYFLSLNTSRRIAGRPWTPLPTPAEVIKRVNIMSCKTKTSNKLTFQHSDMSKVGDSTSNEVITAVV